MVEKISVEGFQAYFGRLEELSNAELEGSARKLVVTEKHNVARLIAHLSEFRKRRDRLDWSYASLFDYCVRGLHLSEGSVWRRLQVAGVCRRFPQLLVALSENRISLTVASLLAPSLSEENVHRLLSEAEGKSTRQVEEIVENEECHYRGNAQNENPLEDSGATSPLAKANEVVEQDVQDEHFEEQVDVGSAEVVEE